MNENARTTQKEAVLRLIKNDCDKAKKKDIKLLAEFLTIIDDPNHTSEQLAELAQKYDFDCFYHLLLYIISVRQVYITAQEQIDYIDKFKEYSKVSEAVMYQCIYHADKIRSKEAFREMNKNKNIPLLSCEEERRAAG